MLTSLALIIGPLWILKRGKRLREERAQDLKLRIMARVIEADRIKWDASPTELWEVRRVA